NDAREAGSAGCAGCAAQAATAQSVRDHAPRTCASFNPGAGDDGSKMSRERREEMARATRTALPRGDVDGCERRRLLAAFFRLALGRRFALALGRFVAAFRFALGRDAFFFFYAAGRGLGAAIGSPIGIGGVVGAGGYIGSIMPGPVQLLSEKSVGSSIG